MLQMNDVSADLGERTRENRKGLGMREHRHKLCLLSIIFANAAINHGNGLLNWQGEHIPEHKAPLMPCLVLPAHEPLHSLRDVETIEAVVPRTNALALDRDISVLIAELVQKLECNINPPQKGRIVGGHIFELMLSTNLKVS